jgi:hypothetical protein
VFHWLRALGVNPRQTWAALRGLPATWRDYCAFRRAHTGSAAWPLRFDFPSLTDRTAESGVARGAYFHQDLLVARRVHARAPRRHLDVGSRVDGFVAHVASFREIEVLDIRPQRAAVPGLRFLQHDLQQPAGALRAAFDSVSCLHALEHFGLGRYGDPIDPEGWRGGFAHLVELVAPGGWLYFSVPIGPQRVEFNSHRVFGLATLVELARIHDLEIIGFHWVDDAGDLHSDAALTPELLASDAGCWMGCGIFEFRRPPPPALPG